MRRGGTRRRRASTGTTSCERTHRGTHTYTPVHLLTCTFPTLVHSFTNPPTQSHPSSSSIQRTHHVPLFMLPYFLCSFLHNESGFKSECNETIGNLFLFGASRRRHYRKEASKQINLFLMQEITPQLNT